MFLQILKHRNSPGACVLFSPLVSIHKALQREKGAQISTGQTQEQLVRKTGNATKCHDHGSLCAAMIQKGINFSSGSLKAKNSAVLMVTLRHLSN